MNLQEAAHRYTMLYPGFGSYSGQPTQTDMARAMRDAIALAHEGMKGDQGQRPLLTSVVNETAKLAPGSASLFKTYLLDNPQLREFAGQLEFMLTALAERSPETLMHIQHHTPLAMFFYEQRKGKPPQSTEDISELLTTMVAALGHDFGKEGVNPALLHKSTRIDSNRLESALAAYIQTVPDYPNKAHDVAFLRAANDGKFAFATAEDAAAFAKGDYANARAIANGWEKSETHLTTAEERVAHSLIFSRMDHLARRFMPNQAETWLTGAEKTSLAMPQRGTLTPEESAIVNSHDYMSQTFFEQVSLPPFLRGVKQIVSMDTFRHAGTSNKIPEAAHLIHLTDIFEALTADRSYRQALPVNTALKVMSGMAEKKEIDPSLFQDFVERNIPHTYAQHFGLAVASATMTPETSGPVPAWQNRIGEKLNFPGTLAAMLGGNTFSAAQPER
ncbi:MAG: hypothetical protein U1E36_10220 [Rickettsiales bacterium]